MKYRYVLIILFCGLMSFVSRDSCAQISSDKAISSFVGAGLSYKDGQYVDALSQYYSILDAGLENGAVYYNMANSYFKEGDLGNTMLNYERARQFMPRDSDLNFNRQYVSSQIDQYGDGTQVGFLDSLIKGHIEFYTLDEMVIILFILSLIGGMVFLASNYTRWPKNITSTIMTVVLIGILIYGVGLILKVNLEKDLAIIQTTVETYYEPRDDSTVHFKIAEGMKARILKSEGVWVKIKRLDGKVGWVKKDVLERI